VYVAGGELNGVLSNQVYQLEFSAVLPARLRNIFTQALKNRILVSWKTSHKGKTSFFDVQRSADGKNFSSLRLLNAPLNGFATSSYSYTDRQPLHAINYYRIKIIDTDGEFTYSETVSARADDKITFQIFPNPAKDILFVQVNGRIEAATLQITDGIGRKLKEEKITLNGSQTFSINIAGLHRGIYHLSLKGSSTQHLRFLKQ
jgi:hypothetical protein